MFFPVLCSVTDESKHGLNCKCSASLKVENHRIMSGSNDGAVLLHSVSSVAMKQLWGEGNYHTEFDDLMKEKAMTKGTKIMNVLEVLRERSVHPQLCTMLLLLLSLQLCGLSAVEYALFPCLDLLLSLQSATMTTCPFPLGLHYSSSHRAHCLTPVVSSPVLSTTFRELLRWEYKSSSST